MASTPPPPKPPRPTLTYSEDVKPVYTNLVRITHMPSELIIDFALKMPGPSPARVLSQVLMSPLSAKLFFRALGENLSKYEAVFGEIKIPGEGSLGDYSKLFRPPPPPEKPNDQA